MQPSFPISPAWRWRLGIGLVVAFVFCLWLITFVYHRVAKANFEAHVAELVAKGESLEVDDLRPTPIENPEDDVGAAPVFADFLARCRANPKADAGDDPVWGKLDIALVPGYSSDHFRPEENQVSYLICSPLSQGFDPPDEEAAARAILAYCEANAATLDAIREAVSRPAADFRVAYGDITEFYPEILPYTKTCNLLHLQGRAALLLGQPGLARSNALALLRFSRHVGSHSNLFFGAIGGALNHFAITLIHEGLATGKWTDEDLNVLAGELESRWMEAAFLRAVRMERAVMMKTLDGFSRKPAAWNGDEAWWIQPLLQVPDLRQAFVFDNGEFYCRVLDEAMLTNGSGESSTLRIATPFLPMPELTAAGSSWGEKFRYRVKYFRQGFADTMFSAYASSRVAALRSQVAQDLALIAVALALHQRQHGSFPATLDGLTLPSGAPLPLDPFTGVGYVYRAEGENDYLLYSPGPNSLDEGGLIRHDREDGDWVWRLRLPDDFDFDAYGR